MNSKERFFATLDRKPVDRPACWLGCPVHTAEPALYAHFGVTDMAGLKQKLGDDVTPVEVPYHHPPSNHIACAFDFAKGASDDYEERTLTAPGFFEDIEDPEQIEDFDWPDPKQHMNPEECRQVFAGIPEDQAVLGVLWSAHFQDACAAFGMESALMTMLETPEMFQAVIDRILAFYLEANEIFYKAAGDHMDAVLIGNDFGSQTGLMVGADALREFVFPGTRKLIEQAHAYGYRVIHHSCGAIRELIPDLVNLGADAIHPIQALAVGMEASSLKESYGDQASFCGGVDAQELLVHGTPDAIRETVEQLRTLFPTGLVISPSHEAILPDIPPANIEALFNAATA